MQRFKALVYCAGLFTLPAQAIPVIDQNQDIVGGRIANFSPQRLLAQSFRQTQDTISGAGIFLTAAPGFTDTVTISLWNALPGEAGASQLATASGLGQHDAWLDVFWSPVSLLPVTTYYLVFSAANSVLSLGGNRANPYADGQAYLGSLTPTPTADYAFRTYYDKPGSPVPEPATLALFGVGVSLLALARRRATRRPANT